jgi:hypothetical protein
MDLLQFGITQEDASGFGIEDAYRKLSEAVSNLSGIGFDPKRR